MTDPVTPATLRMMAERLEDEDPNLALWTEAAATALGKAGSRERFRVLCKHGAWLDAAAMLMPPGWLIYNMIDFGSDESGLFLAAHEVATADRMTATKAQTKGPHREAQARAAVAMRARAVEAGQTTTP